MKTDINSETKSQTHSIALDYVNGNQTAWNDKLETLIIAAVESTIDEETTFESLVKEVEVTVDNLFIPYIEENLYDILSEREVFDEQHWKNTSEQLTKAVKLFVSTKVDEIVSNILDQYVDSVEYTRSPTRYFGFSGENDF